MIDYEGLILSYQDAAEILEDQCNDDCMHCPFSYYDENAQDWKCAL